MKRLGIDARLYRQTGVGVYIRNLLHFISEYLPDDLEIFVYLMRDDFEKVSFPDKRFIKRVADYRWHGIAEQTGFLKALNEVKLDLMHFTYFSYPIMYRRPFISTVHDLTPYLFKTGRASTRSSATYSLKHFFFTKVLKAQVAHAKAVITPTKTVKDQILKNFGMKYQSKVHPIYEGVNEELFSIKANSDLKSQFGDDFMVYIGNFYPHKNVERLIQAYANVTTRTKLILVGPDDFFTKQMEKLVRDLEQEDRIIFYKNATLRDLVFFYKNTRALVNPSLSEGFGLPLIEAVYFNCPVIASDIQVFKETLGDRYYPFDPEDVENMTYTFASFLKSRKTVSYGTLLEKFSFEKMGKETAKLYLQYL